MYINPGTTIKILKNAPLDNTYRNTIYFADASAQASYFSGLAKYTYVNTTYQRLNGSVRVETQSDNLYDCNYIMFQNGAYGNKWFYAFVTHVLYVNDNCTELSFEVDIMQTWFFDYTVNPSFVEREHGVSDNVGDNLVPENFELGEYIGHDFMGTNRIYPLKIVIASTFDTALESHYGTSYGGIFSGLVFNVFDEWQGAHLFIYQATEANKSAGIVACFMMPEAFIVAPGASVNSYPVNFDKWLTDIDGYIPKNKKLFTHPYNFLYCTNLAGNSAEFKYEYFSGPTCSFTITGDMSCNPQTMIYPTNYKGLPSNYNEKMILDGFPQCPFTTDTFKAWLAQNANSLGISMLGSAFTAAMGAATMYSSGGTVGAPQVMTGVMGVAGTVAKVLDTSSLPPQAHGSPGTSAATALGIKDFAFIHMTIRAEFAKIIDDFFSCYGYATHRVKVPNRSSRPAWNYVKTQNVSLTGSVPAADMARLRQIYDNGVTFWRNGANVGNYNLNNTP